jgi:cell division protein FtsB
MSAPESSQGSRPERPRRDDASVPTFLRRRAVTGEATRAGRPHRPPELPRPATPPLRAEPATGPSLDPASLPMPTLSRRRVFTVAGVLIAGWLAVSFARQVGEASAATNRAEQLRDANAALHEEIALLEADLERVQDPNYILQQGRAVGLGARNEIPFALEGDAPPLAVDAPGSAAARLGSSSDAQRPLEAWLTILFGDPAPEGASP